MSKKKKRTDKHISNVNIPEEGFPEKIRRKNTFQKKTNTLNPNTKQKRPRKIRSLNPKLNLKKQVPQTAKIDNEQDHQFIKLFYGENNKIDDQEVSIGKEITELDFQSHMLGLYETLQNACLLSAFALSKNEEDKFQFFECFKKHLFFKTYHQGSNHALNIYHAYSKNPKRLYVAISIKSYDYCTIFSNNKDPYLEDSFCEPSLLDLANTIPLHEYINCLSTDRKKRIPIVFCGHGLELDSKNIKLILGKELIGIGFGSPMWLKSNKIQTLNDKFKLLNYLFFNVHCRIDLLPIAFTYHFTLCEQFIRKSHHLYKESFLKNNDRKIKKHFEKNKLNYKINDENDIHEIYDVYCSNKFESDIKYSPIGIIIHSKKNKKFKLIFERDHMNAFYTQLPTKMKQKNYQTYYFHNIFSYLKIFNLIPKKFSIDNDFHIYNNKNKENINKAKENINKNNDNDGSQMKIRNHPRKHKYNKFPITINNVKVFTFCENIQITLIGKNLDNTAMRIRNKIFRLDDPYYPLILYNAPVTEKSILKTIQISPKKLIFTMSNFKNFNFHNFSFQIKTLFNASQKIHILEENIIQRKTTSNILKNFKDLNLNFFGAIITQSIYQIKGKLVNIEKLDSIQSEDECIERFYLSKIFRCLSEKEQAKLMHSSPLFNYFDELLQIYKIKPTIKDFFIKKFAYTRGIDTFPDGIKNFLHDAPQLIDEISQPLLLSLKNNLNNYNDLCEFGIYLDPLSNNKLRIGKHRANFSNSGNKMLNNKQNTTPDSYLQMLKFLLIELKFNLSEIDLTTSSMMETEIINKLIGDQKDLKNFIINNVLALFNYIHNDINVEEITDSGNDIHTNIDNTSNNEIEIKIEKEIKDDEFGYDSNKDKINQKYSGEEENGMGINYEDSINNKNQKINQKLTTILNKKLQNYKNFTSNSQLLINKKICVIFLINEMRNILSKRLIIGVVGVSNSGKTTFINQSFNKNLKCGITLEERTEGIGLLGLNSNNYFIMDFPGSDDVKDSVKKLNDYFNCNPCLFIYITAADHIQRSERKGLKEISKYNAPIFICLNKVDHYPELLKDRPSRYRKFLGTNSPDIFWTCFNPNKSNTKKELKVLQKKINKSHNYRSIDDIKKWIVKKLYQKVKNEKFLLNELKKVVDNEFKLDFETIKNEIENELKIMINNNKNNNTNTINTVNNNNNSYDENFLVDNQNFLKNYSNLKKDVFQLKPKDNLTITTSLFTPIPKSKKKKINFFKFRAVVISDLHLGAGITMEKEYPKYKNRDLLTKFLKSITKEKTISHLILLGDIWDNWSVSMNIQPPHIDEVIRHYTWFKTALIDIYKSGKKIIYIKGTHDFDLTENDLSNSFSDIKIEFYKDKFYYGSKNEILFQHGNNYDLFNQKVYNFEKLQEEFNYPFGYYLNRLLFSSNQYTNQRKFIKEFVNSQIKEKKKNNFQKDNVSNKLLKILKKLKIKTIIEKLLVRASGNEKNWNDYQEKNICTNIPKDYKYLEIPIKSKGFWIFKSKGILDSYSDYFQSLKKLEHVNQLNQYSRLFPHLFQAAIGNFDFFLNNEAINGTKVVVLGHTHESLLTMKKFKSRKILYANSGCWSAFSKLKSWLIIEVDNKNKINVDLKQFSKLEGQVSETFSISGDLI
ncbi:hypothetical protein M0813_30263 [Anaeramoeba flamelloides]|uniref:G domain-containing protein n=1 Tax=Anaeramoeba flamelloides TaxID=1746091 RepID=A0ABQ8XKK1_9EUKA|nr:hypothetical protein M0813_30263 [Anaeramoeba flamelloides]